LYFPGGGFAKHSAAKWVGLLCPRRAANNVDMPAKYTLPKSAAYRARIDGDNPKCLKEWLACLEYSEKRLRRAVAEVGTNPLFVRRALERGLFKAD
jgi:hypothetical protein